MTTPELRCKPVTGYHRRFYVSVSFILSIFDMDQPEFVEIVR
jgi:hypothetical protein